MLLIKKKINKIEFHQKQISIDINELNKKLKLQQANSLEEREIIKSFIKGIIRYSKPCKKILQILIKQKIFNKFLNNNINYISIPYPMIHLKKDFLEAGGFHNDQIGSSQMYTCWIPITKYKYPALSRSIIIRKNLNFLNIILKKLNLLKIFKINIFVKFGEAYLWDAKIFHRGNLNVSNKISSAFQFKITQSPFFLEKSFKIGSKFDYKSINKKKIIVYFRIYLKFIKLLKKNKINNVEDLENFILLNKLKKNQSISFALSVLSQRLIFAKSKKLNLGLDNEKIFLIDYMSLLLGADNLISVKRLIFYFKKRNDNSSLKKLKKYLNKIKLSKNKIEFLMN